MPIQPINFAEIKPQGRPELRNLDVLGDLLAGYKAGAYPYEQREKMLGDKEQRRALMLKNALEEAFGAKERQAGLGLTGAQTNHMNASTKQLQMETDPQAYARYALGLQKYLQNPESNQPDDVNDITSSANAGNQYKPNNDQHDDIVNAYNNIVQNGESAPKVAPQQHAAANSLADMIIKKKLGIPLQSPEEVAQQKVATKVAEDKQIQDAKERRAFEQEAPLIKDRLSSVNRAISIAKKHPEYFTPITGRLGEKYMRATNNEKDYGELQILLAELVAPFSQELSSRGLASALNYAMATKPAFNENPNAAIGKLEKIKSKMENALSGKEMRYENIGGSPVSHNKDPLGIGL